ncbi:hypothetical protein [Salinisphaera sp.]|uniref:hypothetical protein n=1 Tax=Salinisphaera sp. TaxID=1914330 RepID=UPI002D77CF9A|nr:hypothetical protein [Salinisphaera sp.]HET7313301.1 hypothetical protein [Salinisphaera sp.]
MPCDAQTLIRRYGTAAPETEPQALAIGRTTLLWHAGAVRRLAFDGVETLRGLSTVIRDARWGTCRLSTAASDVTRRDSAIELRQESHLVNQGDSILSTVLTLSVAETRLEARLRLAAEQPFETCRSGLVVLLPLAHVIGRAATVIHDDGSEEAGRLDERISPSQPFFSIRRLRLAPTPALDMTLDLEGDVFEMEDQRNWSDASLKIYNRPLAWPSPYRLEAGECVEQRVSLTIETNAEGSAHA